MTITKYNMGETVEIHVIIKREDVSVDPQTVRITIKDSVGVDVADEAPMTRIDMGDYEYLYNSADVNTGNLGEYTYIIEGRSSDGHQRIHIGTFEMR